MTAGFHFDASCPRCGGGLLSDPTAPDAEHGPAVDVQCRTCRCSWQIRVTVIPAGEAPVACPYCGRRVNGERGLRAHVGSQHQNRHEETVVDPSEQPRPMVNWLDRAACRGMDPDVFMPPQEDSGRPLGPEALKRIATAKAVCADCPVVAECLADTEVFKGWRDHSIRGGMTPAERYRRKRVAS